MSCKLDWAKFLGKKKKNWAKVSLGYRTKRYWASPSLNLKSKQRANTLNARYF